MGTPAPVSKYTPQEKELLDNQVEEVAAMRKGLEHMKKHLGSNHTAVAKMTTIFETFVSLTNDEVIALEQIPDEDEDESPEE